MPSINTSGGATHSRCITGEEAGTVQHSNACPAAAPPTQSRAQLDSRLEEARQQASESMETAALFRREAEQARAEVSKLQVLLEEVGAGGAWGREGG